MIRPPLRAIAGLGVWAAHFTAIYAVTAHACERDLAGRTLLGMDWVTAWVVLATLAALALLALAMRRHAAEPPFIRRLTLATGLLAALAILFEALPVLLIPAC